MKKSTIAILLSAVLLAVAVWWANFGENNQQPHAKTNDLTTQDPEATTDTEEGTTPEESQPISVAKSITHVPANNHETSQSENEFENEIQQSTKRMLESAIAGKAEDAIDISQLLKQCNKRLDEGLLRSQLDQMKNSTFSPSTTHSMNGISGSFSSFEEFEAAMWRSFDQCRAIKDLFDDDLRERLKNMARNGSVIARFLYATWPPKHPDQIAPEYTLALLEYQNLALEFTWQNLNEAEPLGVLAFGLSFGIGSPYLFTSPNMMQHHNFILAAKKCGLSSPWLDLQVSQIREQWAGVYEQSDTNPFEEHSDETKELFCD